MAQTIGSPQGEQSGRVFSTIDVEKFDKMAVSATVDVEELSTPEILFLQELAEELEGRFLAAFGVEVDRGYARARGLTARDVHLDDVDSLTTEATVDVSDPRPAKGREAHTFARTLEDDFVAKAAELQSK